MDSAPNAMRTAGWRATHRTNAMVARRAGVQGDVERHRPAPCARHRCWLRAMATRPQADDAQRLDGADVGLLRSRGDEQRNVRVGEHRPDTDGHIGAVDCPVDVSYVTRRPLSIRELSAEPAAATPAVGTSQWDRAALGWSGPRRRTSCVRPLPVGHGLVSELARLFAAMPLSARLRCPRDIIRAAFELRAADRNDGRDGRRWQRRRTFHIWGHQMPGCVAGGRAQPVATAFACGLCAGSSRAWSARPVSAPRRGRPAARTCAASPGGPVRCGRCDQRCWPNSYLRRSGRADAARRHSGEG